LHIGEQILKGARDYKKLCTDAKEHLSAAGFEPDYVEVRDSSDLGRPDETAEMLVILAAATLGRARLIDNIQVDLRAESLD
ncbi:MAG: pantoate--beta-alanine ligase, partial [Gammaproteobacteria bacterium]|nr:pantoate--beta-alanine ligase [Gammaproteobacteria bacterium]